MNGKHTPGPWYIEGDTIFSTANESSYKYGICTVRDERDMPILVTAPELLESLKRAVEILESEPDAYGIYKAHREQFRAAIRKAKGE